MVVHMENNTIIHKYGIHSVLHAHNCKPIFASPCIHKTMLIANCTKKEIILKKEWKFFLPLKYLQQRAAGVVLGWGGHSRSVCWRMWSTCRPGLLTW